MNFQKSSKRGRGVIFNPKITLQILDLYKGLFPKKLQYNFPKMSGGGGVEGRLEFFRKFIRFGSVTRPYRV